MLNFRFINSNFAFFWNRQVDHNPTKKTANDWNSRIWTIYYRAIVSDRRFQMVHRSGTQNPPRVVELAADWLRYHRDIFLCGNEEHTWNRKVSCTFHIYYAPCAWIYCMFFVYGDVSKFSTQNSIAQHCFPHIHVLKYNALSGITCPGFLCTPPRRVLQISLFYYSPHWSLQFWGMTHFKTTLYIRQYWIPSLSG